MGIERVIAARFFRSRRYPRLPSQASFLSMAGIAAGVASLILVLSVMGGFQRALMERLLRFSPHIRFDPQSLTTAQASTLKQSFENLTLTYGNNLHVSRFSEAPALALTPRGLAPILLQGWSEAGWAPLRPTLEEGQLPEPEDDTAVVLGRDLADDLDVGVGEFLDLVNPFDQDVFGALPASQRFRVSGIFKTGVFESDQRGAWCTQTAIHTLFGFLPERDRWAFRIFPLELIPNLARKLRQEVEQHAPNETIHLLTWEEMNETLFHSMKLEQRSMFILLSFIIAVAALNIAILLTMTVNERRAHIGMLMTLGLGAKRVKKLFALYGLRLGLLGTFAGLVLGIGAVILLKTYPLIRLPDVYYDQTLPLRLAPWLIVFVAVAALAISFMASLLPARHAAHLDPIEALRNGR